MSEPKQPQGRPVRVYNAKSLGTALREYRKEAGMTQSQLARRLGVARSYLSELEQGKETEHLRRLLAAFTALGVKVSLHHGGW